jgi:3'(2'), 5'-bisphosphate nucleotidase
VSGELSPLLQRVGDIARAAGEAILTVYSGDFDVVHKSDRSPTWSRGYR